MTALAEFISFCVVVFVELVQLTIDLLALPFLVAAMLMPWRLPFLVAAAKSNITGRGTYRETAVAQFFIGIFEGVTLVILPIVALSGLRTAMLLEELASKMGNGESKQRWNPELLCSVWEQLVKLLRDVVPFFCLLLALAMPWRWPYIARGLARHGNGWLFQTIVPCATPKANRHEEGEVLGNWCGQAFVAIIDLVTAFPLIFVLGTGLRTRKLLNKLRSEAVRKAYVDEVEFNFKARTVVWGQFFSLLVDLIFVPLALFVLLSGWRSLSLLQLLRDKELKGMEKRGRAILLFFETLVDVPFLLAALIPALTPWRTYVLWRELKLWDRKDTDAEARHGAICTQCAEALKDWAHLLPAAYVLCTPWRAKALWAALAFGSADAKATPSAKQRREDVRAHCHETLLDHPHVVMGGVVLIFCPWRAAGLWRAAKPWPGATRSIADTRVGDALEEHRQPPVVITAAERREAARSQCGRFLVDLPCIVMASVVLVTFWRAPLLWRALRLGATKDVPSAEKRWEACATHFFSLLRDAPFLVLAPLTSYRLPRVALKLIATRKGLLDATPRVEVTGARAGSDEQGRVRLHLTASKPATLTASKVTVTAGGAAFWESVGEAYGKAASSVAKTMLPYSVMPKYLHAAELAVAEAETVQLVFTAGGAVKPLQKLRDSGDAPFVLQGQFRGGGGSVEVLFEFVMRPSDLLASDVSDAQEAIVEEGFGPAPLHALPLVSARPELDSVEPIQEVVWSVVALELVQIVLDLVRIVATVALLLAPWRFFQLLRVTLEPVKRWPVRQIEALDQFFHDECTHSSASLDALHARLSTAARGTELDFPPPEYPSEVWRGPPLPTCKLFVGLAKPGARAKAVAKLSKWDESLAALWSELLSKQPLRRLLLVMEAELLRGLLYPPHWCELRHRLHLLQVEPVRSTFVPTAQPVPAELHAAALLRTVDALREGVVREEGALWQKLRDARAARKELLGGCKIAPSAVCKRSASKGRQQVAVLCKGALLDWLAILGALLLLLSAYRAPSLALSLRGIRCWRSVHCRVAAQLKEVPHDLLMLLQLVFLTCAFWQALEMWLEWSDLLLVRRDVPAARKALRRRIVNVVGELGERVCMLLSPLVLWDTYKFVLATLCFGCLVPVHLIGKLLSLLLPCRGSRRADATGPAEPTRMHFWLAAGVWACFVGFPFIFIYRIAPNASVELDVNATPAVPPAPPSAPPAMPPPPAAPLFPNATSPANGTASVVPLVEPLVPRVLTETGALTLPIATGSYLGGVLLLGALSSGVAMSSAGLLQLAAPRRVLRCTAANGFALVQIVFEAVQLLSLPFLALHAAGGVERYLEAGLLRSSGLFHVMRHVADAALLWQQMTTPALTMLVFTAFGALCLWYLLFSLPVVVDDLLKWQSSHGRVQHSKLWQLVMFPLHSTLHVTVVLQLIKPLGCTATPGKTSTLYADPSITCWDPRDTLQPTMALCSLLGLAFYLLTVHMLSGDGGLLRQAQESATLDVRYSELYVIVGNAVRAASAVCYLLLHDYPMALLAVLLGAALFLLVWTLAFHRLFHAPACAIRGVVELRAVGEALAAWAAMSCLLDLLLASAEDTSVPVMTLGASTSVHLPELVCLSGWLAVAVLGLLAVTCRKLLAAHRRHVEVAALRACAQLVLDIEKYWQQQGGVMGALWGKTARAWRRAASRVADVPALRRTITALEQHVRAGAQRATWLERRAEWQRELRYGPSAIEVLRSLVTELQESVMIVGKVVLPVRLGFLPSALAQDEVEEAQVTALLGAWRLEHRVIQNVRDDDFERNTLRLRYSNLYELLVSLRAHANSFVRGDEQTSADVATGVSVPTMVVAGDCAVPVTTTVPAAAPAGAVAQQCQDQPSRSYHHGRRQPATATEGRRAPGDASVASVVLTVPTDVPLDGHFATLLDQMRTAPTNFERLELVEEFARRRAARSGNAPRLSCSQLGLLAEVVTLSNRRKAVLQLLHPYLTDKANFSSLVDAQLELLYDREDVKRAVATAERRAWLESALEDD